MKWANALFILACCLVLLTPVVHADTLQSPNYRFEESLLGGSGLNQSNSASYQGSISVGDASIGGSSSTNYQVQAGSKTTNDPALSFNIANGNANFGSFTPASGTVATSAFSVSNYTSYGYTVQIIGAPPSNGSHTITAMASTDISRPSTEQFGINLVANTSPTSVGANPDNGQFGFGSVTANYGTSNSYRYVSGETIASSPKSSGMTTYTITYLVNVGNLTPGGQYTSNQTLVITGTF